MKINITIYNGYGWVVMENICESLDDLELWIQQNKKTIEGIE